MDSTTKLLRAKVEDMSSLQKCMEVLREFRAKESQIDTVITPLLDMYEVRCCRRQSSLPYEYSSKHCLRRFGDSVLA